jgi:hypothetical protein
MSLKNNLFFIMVISGFLLMGGCGQSDESDSSDNLFTSLPEYALETEMVLADQGDLIMGRPSYANIDSDGNMLVMDLGSTEFHLFDTEGNHQASFGRQGKGPGEMQQPRRPILTEEDTLYVSDNVRRALLVFARTGEFAWEHAYDISFPALEEGYPNFALTPTDEGYPIVYSVTDDSGSFPNGYTTVKIINRNGEMIRDTGVAFNSGEMLEVSTEDMQLRLGLSEIRSNQIAPHPNGEYIRAWTGSPELHRFSAVGDSLGTIQLTGYPVQAASSDAISSIAENYGGMFGDLESDLSEAVGDTFPFFSQIQVMNDHSIWLRRITPGDSGQSWYHLTPDGKPQGKLTLGEGESLRNSSSDFIYVSGEDDSGAPVIIKYRLSEKMADGVLYL